MFRITRGNHIQHGPAYPSPVFRFPDGTPIPIYADMDPDEAENAPPDELPRDAGEKPAPDNDSGRARDA
jgi:hypothetical protein